MTFHLTDARPSRPRTTIALVAALAATAFALAPHVLASASPAPVARVADARAASTYGIWSDSTVPAKRSSADAASTTLGLVFRSDADGRLRGVQYYAAGANRGATTGGLWNAVGRRIASVRFAAASRDGWKTAMLSSPAKIRAGEKYTVSYRAPHGRYVARARAFTRGRSFSHRDLTALRGTYRHGPGRPTASRGSHYFIDVLFAPSSRTRTTNPTPTPTPTPTPAPSGDLTGWQVTPKNVGLAPLGLSCATLPAYSGPTVLPAGTTISGMRITVPLDVSAGGIVVEKSCIKPTSTWGGNLVEGYYPQGSITIRDSEFDGSGVPPSDLETACAFAGGGDLLRNYVHDVGSGICMVSSTNTRDTGTLPKDIVIKNNYVHRLFHYRDAHHEAATIRDFVKNGDNTRTMKWIGNYLDSDSQSVSGGMFVQPTFEPIHNVWFQDNVFAGEGFNLWVTASDCCTYSNFHATNNRFQAGTREWYGPVYTEGPGWSEWRDNYLYDASRAEARGALVNP